MLLLFASTFLGVFLAFLLGIWGQSAQRRHIDDLQRYETVQSILGELWALQTTLVVISSVPTDFPGTHIPVDITDNAVRSAISSGRFALLAPSTQIAISFVYSKVRMVEKIMELLYLRPDLMLDRGKEEREAVGKLYDLSVELLEPLIPVLIESLNKTPKPLSSTWDYMMADLG